ncbi:MAG: 50S ribosomal protein L34 [Planctomycetes bacterium]|nr:50S ribosomal protein L34 [Planctomycetota bacterium]HNZ66550.1 50S ribosomal protein L34 [Planctomycetota bacterium]HON45198.1 50S ribosomal protein L34 [Planctomycetota bacterium]HPY75661.1 50S ribosomal protein L34 [Planctomycetota bacterium]HQB00132.1 50S ribosomal protein L34 [Planctomycetota bacterium]
MKINIRNSSVKYRRKNGFLTKMKTKSGRQILKNQRDRRNNRKS